MLLGREEQVDGLVLALDEVGAELDGQDEGDVGQGGGIVDEAPARGTPALGVVLESDEEGDVDVEEEGMAGVDEVADDGVGGGAGVGRRSG